MRAVFAATPHRASRLQEGRPPVERIPVIENPIFRASAISTVPARAGRAAAALTHFLSLALAALLVAGCATERIGQDVYSSGTDELVVRAIGYDDRGLPLRGTPLAERPSRLGDHFTVVRLLSGRPVISYDIAVTKQKPDFAKPLRAVYEWTGRGFTLGAHVTGAMADGGVRIQAQNNEEAFFALALIATPIVAGTAGGFIVGIADGVRQTGLELGKVVVPGEEVLTCTLFDYDASNRLVRMRMLSPDRRRELVRTEFAYRGSATVPSSTAVKSLIEGREREIR